MHLKILGNASQFVKIFQSSDRHDFVVGGQGSDSSIVCPCPRHCRTFQSFSHELLSSRSQLFANEDLGLFQFGLCGIHFLSDVISRELYDQSSRWRSRGVARGLSLGGDAMASVDVSFFDVEFQLRLEEVHRYIISIFSCLFRHSVDQEAAPPRVLFLFILSVFHMC